MDKSTKKENIYSPLQRGRASFTFAELMISLIVISVLSAILYPTVAQFTPNANKPLFKSAYKTLTTVLSELIEESPTGELGIYNAQGNFGSYIAARLCREFCRKANVTYGAAAMAVANPVARCETECADVTGGKVANTITTSNGMRWAFFDYNQYTNPTLNSGSGHVDRSEQVGGDFVFLIRDEFGNDIRTFQIFVDVNSSNNNLTQVGLPVGATCPARSIPTATTNAGDVRICRLFNNACTGDRNGGCGVFYFDQTNNALTGIYDSSSPNNIPDFRTGVDPRQPVYNQEHLRTQDTFEILVDSKGKIVAMSPAAWANLEDNNQAGD